MAERASQERFDRAVQVLVDATESLHTAVLGDQEAARLDVALDRRDKAFQTLSAASKADARPDAAARACLAQIKSFDDEILAHGLAEVGELRGQRQRMQRRRSAIQAHSKRERGEPRLLTVKA